ncbi:MAG TPA: SDR family oxidoreductase [Vicinamibacterales bacterium]|jgi:NAD(P)-dependent dehydrogenase (short-subunit alcohol dehydrogenase family)|nr:SDR family oxidoreductase [Vicinamibacterales bacterium]
MFDLQGKVAVVTGAGSGIGAAIARLFASRGATIAAVDLDAAAARTIALDITRAGGAGAGHPCDVSQPSAVDGLFRGLTAANARLDILVNNAGIAHVGTIEQTTPEDLDRLYRVNVFGVYLCARAAVPVMLRQGGGVILNMASIASLIGLPDRFAYSMSKGAVLSMTRSIAVDYVTRGIRCNCICPARVHTPFVDGFVAKNYPGREAEMMRTLSAAQPIGRMGTPEEVAQLALYLCSDEASFVTGAAYPLDGGVTAV